MWVKRSPSPGAPRQVQSGAARSTEGAVAQLEGHADAEQDHRVAQDVVLPRDGRKILAQRGQHLPEAQSRTRGLTLPQSVATCAATAAAAACSSCTPACRSAPTHAKHGPRARRRATGVSSCTRAVGRKRHQSPPTLEGGIGELQEGHALQAPLERQDVRHHAEGPDHVLLRHHDACTRQAIPTHGQQLAARQQRRNSRRCAPENRKAENHTFMYWSMPSRGLAKTTENTWATHSSDQSTNA
eukprot:scaffold5846_cov333-Prasinococcus_capsulatus_cf.AAC.8